jgi:hypothetical protein
MATITLKNETNLRLSKFKIKLEEIKILMT